MPGSSNVVYRVHRSVFLEGGSLSNKSHTEVFHVINERSVIKVKRVFKRTKDGSCQLEFITREEEDNFFYIYNKRSLTLCANLGLFKVLQAKFEVKEAQYEATVCDEYNIESPHLPLK